MSRRLIMVPLLVSATAFANSAHAAYGPLVLPSSAGKSRASNSLEVQFPLGLGYKRFVSVNGNTEYGAYQRTRRDNGCTVVVRGSGTGRAHEPDPAHPPRASRPSDFKVRGRGTAGALRWVSTTGRTTGGEYVVAAVAWRRARASDRVNHRVNWLEFSVKASNAFPGEMSACKPVLDGMRADVLRSAKKTSVHKRR